MKRDNIYGFNGRQIPTNIVSKTQDSRSANAWAKLRLRPDVYILDPSTGLPAPLIEVFKSDNLLIRGLEDVDGEIMGTISRLVSQLNARPGAQWAAYNNTVWSRISKNYVNTLGFKIAQDRAKVNLTELAGNILKQVREVHGEDINFRIGHSYNQNLVDPFMRIDPNIVKAGWDINDTSRFKFFASNVQVHGNSFAHVGNTFTSYMKIQDVDADALESLQLEIFKGSERVGKWMYDVKYPLTSFQKGSFVDTGYDPNLKYRRMKGVESESLGKLLDGMRELQEYGKSTTWSNRDKVRQIIHSGLREDLTGILTTSLWQSQELETALLIRNLPEIMISQLGKTPEQVKIVMDRLHNDPSSRAIFKSLVNDSKRGTTKHAVETILKKRATDLSPDKLVGTVFESLLLDVALQKQEELLMLPKHAENMSASDRQQFLMTMLFSSSEERTAMILGLKDPMFRKGRPFLPQNKVVTPEKITYNKSGRMTAIGDHKLSRTPILDSLLEPTVRDPITGRFESLLKAQEVDFRHLFKGGNVTEAAGKGVLVSFNEFGQGMSLKPKPLSGKAAEFDGAIEEVFYLPQVIRDNQVVDPMVVLKEELERKLVAIAPESHPLRAYGIGALTGTFSLDYLRTSKGAGNIKKLADISGYSENMLRNMINSGTPEDLKILGSIKMKLDLEGYGVIGNSVQTDLYRLLQKTVAEIGGVSTPMSRDAGGRFRPVGLHQAQELASLLAFDLGLEFLDPAERAEKLADAMLEHPFLMYDRPTNSNGRFSNAQAGRITSGGRLVPAFGEDDTLWSPKRTGKIMPTSHSSISAGKMNIALFDFDTTGYEDIFKGAYGNKDQFQAIHPSEGQMFITQNAFENMRSAVLERGFDVSPIRQGEYTKPVKWKDSLGTIKEGYVKAGVDQEFWRVLHDKQGTTRIVPWIMPTADAMARTTNGMKEISGFMGIGEAISKDYSDIFRQIARQSPESMEAYEKLAANFTEENKQAFLETLPSSEVFVEIPDGNGGKMVKSFKSYTAEVEFFLRDTDTARKTNTFNWAELENSVKGLPDFDLRGRATQELVPEFAIGLSEALQAAGINVSPEFAMSSALKGMAAQTALSEEEKQVVYGIKQLMGEKGEANNLIPNFFSSNAIRENNSIMNADMNSVNSLVPMLKKMGFQKAVAESSLGTAVDILLGSAKNLI